MRKFAVGVLVAAMTVPVGLTAPAMAQMTDNVTSQELIQKLTPTAKQEGVKFRGLRISADDKPLHRPSVDMHIQFEFDSAELKPETMDKVKALADALRSPALSRYTFLVEGHTDSVGTPEYNRELSRKRAQAVYDTLVAQYGVDKARLRAEGRGMEVPLAGKDPTAPENRRVQITNLGEN